MENQTVCFHTCSTDRKWGKHSQFFFPLAQDWWWFPAITSLFPCSLQSTHPSLHSCRWNPPVRVIQGWVSLLLMTLHMSAIVDFNLKLFLTGFHATLVQCSTSSYWLIWFVLSAGGVVGFMHITGWKRMRNAWCVFLLCSLGNTILHIRRVSFLPSLSVISISR